MRNERTPRTLAESSFVTGYQRAHIPQTDRIAGWLLAIAIGIVCCAMAIHYLGG